MTQLLRRNLRFPMIGEVVERLRNSGRTVKHNRPDKRARSQHRVNRC